MMFKIFFFSDQEPLSLAQLSINQSTKFYSYSPYSQITICLIGPNKVPHPIPSARVRKKYHNNHFNRGKNVETSESVSLPMSPVSLPMSLSPCLSPHVSLPMSPVSLLMSLSSCVSSVALCCCLLNLRINHPAALRCAD